MILLGSIKTRTHVLRLDCGHIFSAEMLDMYMDSFGQPGEECKPHHMSHSLNSFRGNYIEDYIGDYYRGY